jgi:hypothetical protein
MNNTNRKFIEAPKKFFLLLVGAGLVTTAIAPTAKAEDQTPKWKPTITEEKKEKIQDFIFYFVDAQKAEMLGDDDYSQAFPWRSFRASIEALKTPEASSWIIDTIPSWVDGRDQKTMALLCQKTADLATPKELAQLITILKNPTTPEESRAWGLTILEKTTKEENLNYLQGNIQGILVQNDSKNNVEIAKSIAVALKGRVKQENIDILNSILEALESNNAQRQKEGKS